MCIDFSLDLKIIEGPKILKVTKFNLNIKPELPESQKLHFLHLILFLFMSEINAAYLLLKSGLEKMELLDRLTLFAF